MTKGRLPLVVQAKKTEKHEVILNPVMRKNVRQVLVERMGKEKVQSLLIYVIESTTYREAIRFLCPSKINVNTTVPIMRLA